jgi:16S rRNA (adenine(1408)-N(1))-methyltransferase
MIVVVTGKQASAMSADELRVRIDQCDAVTVDVGAGDGGFAYRYARAHPERFVIGIDPVRENVREMSARAARKPERGGAPNAMFVVASVEMMPEELSGIADEVFVTLPWGSLMRGIILGEAAVLEAIARITQADGSIRIVLNTRIFDDPVPVEARDLPELSPEYAREVLVPAFEGAGMPIVETRWLTADEVAAIPTTWAKRLSHRAPPRSLLVVARRGTR